ncbi:unnamed protein product [Oppiella nova]|nr:unnamed protein product [Oppiella nova]CAG2182445.1 unnamed protein product [Oppiella nova]
MWFGTDDSSVHIYSCFDAIRIKKNKVKVTLSAKVEAIAFFNEKVFVCLANQSVAIFHREPSGVWNTSEPEIREHMNCLRLCPSGQQLWTSGRSLAISVRDADLNPLFDDIRVDDTTTTDDDFITQMVASDDADAVFVASHDSLVVRALSAQSPFAPLFTVSIHATLIRGSCLPKTDHVINYCSHN